LDQSVIIYNNNNLDCKLFILDSQCTALLASQLTVISMHLLWNHEPQHPKNATMKTMTPTAMQRLSALIMLYLGSNCAYPAYESRSQIPTPRIPQPQSWNETTIN